VRVADSTKSLHVPVINIPAFKGANGMPIGLSLVAGRYHDQHLLKVCEVVGELLMMKGGWNTNLQCQDYHGVNVDE
jgi:amidase